MRGDVQTVPAKKRRTIPGRASLTVTLSLGDKIPTEFRIFKAGVNESEKGSYLFDERAAAITMAAFVRHGVDRMIDLEHLSLDPEAPNFDPDARAAFSLELRDGELWAVNVRWTEDGKRRLREKTQRFISPAFLFDRDGRITKLFNVALTAQPATHGTPELVAARATFTPHNLERLAAMLPTDLVMQAIDALANGDGDAAIDILKQVLAASAGGAPPVDDAPAEGDPPVEGEALQEGEDDEPKDEDEMAAATARLCALTETKTLPEAEIVLASWRTSHLSLEANREQTAADRAALDAEEYRKHTTTLVKLGVEFPATAWELSDKGVPTDRPCARVLAEPLVALRARVALLSMIRKTIDSDNPKPKSGNEHGLTDQQIAICAETGCDPETFAALNAS